MPEDVANSLTEIQLATLEHALESGRWRNHPLDIRLSIPVFRKRFYLVLVGGPEQRSRERRKLARAGRLRTMADVVVFAVFLSLLAPALVGSIYLISVALPG